MDTVVHSRCDGNVCNYVVIIHANFSDTRTNTKGVIQSLNF